MFSTITLFVYGRHVQVWFFMRSVLNGCRRGLGSVAKDHVFVFQKCKTKFDCLLQLYKMLFV